MRGPIDIEQRHTHIQQVTACIISRGGGWRGQNSLYILSTSLWRCFHTQFCPCPMDMCVNTANAMCFPTPTPPHTQRRITYISGPPIIAQRTVSVCVHPFACLVWYMDVHVHSAFVCQTFDLLVQIYLNFSSIKWDVYIKHTSRFTCWCMCSLYCLRDVRRTAICTANHIVNCFNGVLVISPTLITRECPLIISHWWANTELSAWI